MVLMGDIMRLGRKWDMRSSRGIISRVLDMGHMGGHRDNMLMIGGVGAWMGLWGRCWGVWLVVVVWMLVCCSETLKTPLDGKGRGGRWRWEMVR